MSSFFFLKKNQNLSANSQRRVAAGGTHFFTSAIDLNFKRIGEGKQTLNRRL